MNGICRTGRGEAPIEWRPERGLKHTRIEASTIAAIDSQAHRSRPIAVSAAALAWPLLFRMRPDVGAVDVQEAAQVPIIKQRIREQGEGIESAIRRGGGVDIVQLGRGQKIKIRQDRVRGRGHFPLSRCVERGWNS